MLLTGRNAIFPVNTVSFDNDSLLAGEHTFLISIMVLSNVANGVETKVLHKTFLCLKNYHVKLLLILAFHYFDI